jgi:hypothetical protein
MKLVVVIGGKEPDKAKYGRAETNACSTLVSGGNRSNARAVRLDVASP